MPVIRSRPTSQYIASCACPFHCPLNFLTASATLAVCWKTNAVSVAGSRGEGSKRFAGINPIWPEMNVCSSTRTACEYGPMFAGAQ